jgi:DNA-binding beta-propeller fold protein YncE
MQRVLVCLVAAIALFSHPPLPAAAARQSGASDVEIAVVASAEAATVTLVDVRSRSILGVIDVNPAKARADGPGKPNFAQDTDVSPDGRTLYVSRGYLGDVAAFDIATFRLLWQRSLNTGRADHMTVTPDGRSLFVSAMLDNRLYKISTATGEIARHLVTGIYPHDVKVSKDGRRLFSTSLGPLAGLPRSANAPPLTETPGFPFQLTIADVETLQVSDRIRLETAFRPWQFSPDERQVYAQLSNQHVVVRYDMATRTVDRRLELPVKSGVTAADWDFDAPHHGLALTPDGRTLCLAGRASDYAALVDARDLSLIATIPTGDGPGWAEVTADGRFCLVANTRAGDLSIIDIARRAEVARLPVDKGPKHITMARLPAAVLAAVKTRRGVLGG